MQMVIASTLNLQIFQEVELSTFLILRSYCTWCKLLVKSMRARGPWCHYLLTKACMGKQHWLDGVRLRYLEIEGGVSRVDLRVYVSAFILRGQSNTGNEHV